MKSQQKKMGSTHNKIKILKVRTPKHRFTKTIEFFSWLLHLFLSLFTKNKQNSFQKTKKVSSLKISTKNTENITKIETFLRLLMIIRRAVRNFRERTKYRPLKNFDEKEKAIFDDQSYFKKKIKKFRFSFIRNRSFRVFKRKIKVFFRTHFGATLKNLSTN